MEWTDIRLTVSKADAEAAEAVATMIAEGGIFERGEIRKISKINPYAVVIGSSITRPAAITARFVKNLSLR